MPAIDLCPNGDGAFADWQGRRIHHITDTIRVAGLAGGMTSGKPSVMIGVALSDGSVVMAETSLALFLTAADSLKAAYGDPREQWLRERPA